MQLQMHVRESAWSADFPQPPTPGHTIQQSSLTDRAVPIPHIPAELHCRGGGLVSLAAPGWARLPRLAAQQASVLSRALQKAQPHNSASTPSEMRHCPQSVLPDMRSLTSCKSRIRRFHQPESAQHMARRLLLGHIAT